MPTAQTILRALDALWPWRHVLPDDRVGLLVGRRETEATTALMAVDATDDVVAEVVKRRVGVLLTFVPPWTEPLTTLTNRTAVGRRVLALIQAGVALITGHTAWETAREGMTDAVANAFDLRKRRPLVQNPGPAVAKIVATVPTTDVEKLLAAASKADAEVLTWVGVAVNLSGPSGDSTSNSLHRLEFTVLDQDRKTLLTALAAAHPNPDLGLDYVPVGNQERGVGLGRIGELAQRQPAFNVLNDLKRVVDVEHVRVAGTVSSRVKRLAVALRADPTLVQQAVNYGADALIAGDMTYDSIRVAMDGGLVLFDPGFVALAEFALSMLHSKLAPALPHTNLQRMKLNVFRGE